MFVIFGASSDIGQRLEAKLQTANQPVRSISRSRPGCVTADLATGDDLKAALDGAEVVISCAHARYTGGHALVLLVPTMLLIAAIGFLQRLGFSPIHPDVIRRFSEDVDIPLNTMSEELGISPRDFTSGIALAVAEWHRVGVI